MTASSNEAGSSAPEDAWSLTGLWRDVLEIPEALTATLEKREGFDEATAVLSAPDVGRIVATGNGAALYVAQALWLASLYGPAGAPQVLAIPAGLLAAGDFRWREGDVLLAISSSGEFRDVVEAVHRYGGREYVALTTTPTSSLASNAQATALYDVRSQRAVCHTQVFCGSLVAALALWAGVSGDQELASAVLAAPALAASATAKTIDWLPAVAAAFQARPRLAVAFGSGPAWVGAMEASLMLKEVAGVPAEGAETREGATSSMYPLSSEDLVLSLPTRAADARLEDAERVCATTGASVLRAPSEFDGDERLGALAAFPAAAALSILLSLRGGLDPDQPAWLGTYYATARASDSHDSQP